MHDGLGSRNNIEAVLVVKMGVVEVGREGRRTPGMSRVTAVYEKAGHGARPPRAVSGGARQALASRIEHRSVPAASRARK